MTLDDLDSLDDLDLDDECRRLLWSRIAVRFAIGILEDLRTPERIADAMAYAIEGVYPDGPLGDKWLAFNTGIRALTHAGLPICVSLEKGTT